MEDSMAHPPSSAAVWTLSGWKTAVSHLSALFVAILFVVAGVWKVTDPFNAAALLEQALVPGSLSLVGACLLGVAETYSGVLIIVPRFRRWGAWLSAALLLFFMIYIGVNYSVLRGQECNCFPWIKRTVGPGFFVGDAVLLVLAAFAGWWAPPATSRRSAVLVLAAVAVFAAVSYGVSAARQTGTLAPEWIHVEGKPFALHQGRVFLYFFDPECAHCDAAARQMAKFKWRDVKILGVPTENPRFGPDFMRDTGLKAPLTSDLALLRKTFSSLATPYAVALDRGRQRADLTRFDEQEPENTLRRLGFID